MTEELAIYEAPPTALTVFGTDNPDAIVQRVISIATPLARFIEAQDMVSIISGRKYVLAEGWSFMGSMLGVFPRTTGVTELRNPEGDLLGYEAHVELVTRDGASVGAAIAECTRSEEMWGWHPTKRDGTPLPPREWFALKSMAQTRATGKAYRMAFGFVMKAAGYEATPAEEMPALHGEVIDPPRPRQQAQQEGEFRNVGQLLTWALQKHGKDKAWVLEQLNVRNTDDITDLSAAHEELESALSGPL